MELPWNRIPAYMVRIQWLSQAVTWSCKFSVFCVFQYTFALLLIFLLEAMVGIMSFLYEPHVSDELYLNLNKTFIDNYKVDDSKTRAIDQMQIEVVFCGLYQLHSGCEQIPVTFPTPCFPWTIMPTIQHISVYSMFQSLYWHELWRH